MATAKQIAANKLNSLKSTGPKSAETLAITSQNARKHGLCAQFRVIPGGAESQESFNRLREAFIETEKPADPIELELVIKMAEHLWLAKRALYMQEQCFVPQTRTADEQKDNKHPVTVEFLPLEKYLRYHST